MGRRTSVERRRDEDEALRERALESGKQHGKDKSKSSGRREEKEQRSRDEERSKVLDNIKDKEKSREKEKDRANDKERENYRDRDRERENIARHRGKVTCEREKGKERGDREEKDRVASERDKSSGKHKDEKSRKIEDKRNADREKALQLSKIFEEQDNMNDEGSDDEPATQDTTRHLDGVKVVHGLDKLVEGEVTSVVLTLKDQNILAADGDINQEVDMLENVEIREQKTRNEAYRVSKKKVSVYDDKFNDEKKMLPQYDDPVADEGLTLDSSGHFSGEAVRKLEELRRRIEGVSAVNHGEDLNSVGKTSTDYYTKEEMTKFKKLKKNKSLRKKEKLDINALEAEAIAAGLGGGEDLGSRNDGKRQIVREEEDRIEAEMRSNAYESALAKADEASKALRQEQVGTEQIEEEDAPAFGDDDDDDDDELWAGRIALWKQSKDERSGPMMVIKLIASSNTNESTCDNPNLSPGDQPEKKVVLTEMEEFVCGLQVDEEEKKPEMMDVDGGWTDAQETTPHAEEKEEEEVAPGETIHEPAVGKGLAGALQLLKGRGTLKETIEWGDGGSKEIRIERRDEYGRNSTPKEAFRLFSHKFHGKGPGKMKQEKRMRQYQMENSDAPSLSVARMREAQAQLKAPYLVLSGNYVKPGQSRHPTTRGFATGDKKVEHLLNIKRKAENGDTCSQKKPKLVNAVTN